MATLTAPFAERNLTMLAPYPTRLRLKASEVVHKGAYLTIETGQNRVRNFTVADTAASYVGIAAESATGGAADGDVLIEVWRNVEEKVLTSQVDGSPILGANIHVGENNGADGSAGGNLGWSTSATSRIKIGEITSIQGSYVIFKHITALAPVA